MGGVEGDESVQRDFFEDLRAGSTLRLRGTAPLEMASGKATDAG
jgi:hypothetical protein